MEKRFMFELIDGRNEVFVGKTESEAFNRARKVHGDAVCLMEGIEITLENEWRYLPCCNKLNTLIEYGETTN